MTSFDSRDWKPLPCRVTLFLAATWLGGGWGSQTSFKQFKTFNFTHTKTFNQILKTLFQRKCFTALFYPFSYPVIIKAKTSLPKWSEAESPNQKGKENSRTSIQQFTGRIDRKSNCRKTRPCSIEWRFGFFFWINSAGLSARVLLIGRRLITGDSNPARFYMRFAGLTSVHNVTRPGRSPRSGSRTEALSCLTRDTQGTLPWFKSICILL